MKEKLRNKIAVRLCNWILVHVATEHYRLMVTGALKLGLVTAAENELSGQNVHDLIESLGQMKEAVAARTREEEEQDGGED